MSSELKSHQKYPYFSINWDRAIHIDDIINEQLVRRLTPQILKLRQDNNDPITVAIDSPGGSLTSLETLLGLLQGPTQFNTSGRIITVVTNKAYSAAANFLALGDYSVALKHSNVLFHDVRFGEMEDVTPSKALSAAKSLQDENDRFALKLANQVIRRLVWVYLDFQTKFEDMETKYSDIYKKYKNCIPEYPTSTDGACKVNIVSFATALHAHLSLNNNFLINGVMARLAKWVYLTKLSESYPTFREKGSRKPGLLDGTRQFCKGLGTNLELLKNCEKELKLMTTLMIFELNSSDGNFNRTVDEATRSFNLIQSMNDDRHRQSAVRIMLRHPSMFFNVDVKKLNEEDRKAAILAAMPHAQLFWLFCVSLCRELFEGEHILGPQDSQLLGLVDEVAGGGLVESKREFGVSEERTKEKGEAEVK